VENPATHFIPTRSSPISPARRCAGIACANEPSGRGWIPIFEGSSLVPGRARAVIVFSARWSRSLMGGIDATTSAALNQRSGGGVRPACDRPDIGGHCTDRRSAPRDPFLWTRARCARLDTIRAMAAIDVPQSLENLKLERDAIALYDELARIEKDPRRADAFRTISANERRHAGVWADKLRELGANGPEPDGPRLRIRTILLVARMFGTHGVRDLVQPLEGDEEDIYAEQTSPEVEAIAADEREHAEIWRRLSRRGGTPGHAAHRPSVIAAGERWHHAGRSGTLRAVIFGVSDGLVSNL